MDNYKCRECNRDIPIGETRFSPSMATTEKGVLTIWCKTCEICEKNRETYKVQIKVDKGIFTKKWETVKEFKTKLPAMKTFEELTDGYYRVIKGNSSIIIETR